MSVLNQSGEEQVECPLCMEPLEVDDLNFYPCTCGYQICRFCWHRIRTDENGLCPACRKAYSENPADFIPLSKEQVAQLKAEKRQRDQQRKAKLTESRKHLASVRVVQRNLVFVVGLPMRLADAEVLKKHEYFGKFGKIHKVVINQSTAYAGTQGPSASAYVTYMKSDDALRAIQSVNNSTLDGKTIKTSLGTTKYCSHFMKNQPCPKPDCMYLHDFGDQEASFTKEQMHAGKHQEYEKKLHDSLLAKQAAAVVAAQQAAAQAAASVAAAAAAAATDTRTNTNGKAKHTDKDKDKDCTVGSTNGKDVSAGGGSWPHLDKDKEKGESASKNKMAEKSKRSKKNGNVSENNSKNKQRCEESPGSTGSTGTTANKDKDKESNKDGKHTAQEKDRATQREKMETKDGAGAGVGPKDSGSDERERKRPASVVECINNNNTISANAANIKPIDGNPNSNTSLDVNSVDVEGSGDKSHSVAPPRQNGVDVDQPQLKLPLHDDNSSFFTTNSFSCAKLSPETEADDHDDEDEPTSLLNRQISGHLLDIHDGDAWDFDFGYTNHSHHLEELATQRHRLAQAETAPQPATPKDALDSFANGFGAGLDTFSKLDAFMDVPYIAANTESLLETLAKNSVNYQMHPAQQHQQQQVQQQVPPQQQQQQQQHSHYMNGHKEALLSGLGSLSLLEQHQQQQAQQQNYPKLVDMYRRNMCAPIQQHPQQQLMNGLHTQSNGFHNFPQQQQQQPAHHFNHMNLVDKRMALLQHQRQIEENFLNISLGKQMAQQQQHPQHGYSPISQMNGHYGNDGYGNTFGLGAPGSQVGQGQKQTRHVVDDKDLDFSFQEAQKALEALVESDSHVHNSGRTTLGSNQINGLVHSQSGNHLPPPPPGFVQPNSHMNSFGSKILPFLNMNSQQQQQQQQQQQINTSQNNWPSSFSQIQPQQQPQQNQHNKGMGGVCNDWKVLDTAIISSRRHIPSLGPLLDQYAPGTPPGAALQQQQAAVQHQQQAAQQQQRTYDMYATFSNYSNPLPPAYSSAGYQPHLAAQPNLNWLAGGELGAQISTPPGFRTAGQATKQQEC